MLLDAASPDFRQTALQCDVCIVGSGPAGIILAEKFKNTPYTVCWLESGGMNPDATTQQLADGTVTAPSPLVPAEYVSLHSVRHFGGTGSIWGGYTRQLDAADFEQRELPFAHGWPLSRQDLLPFYDWHALEKKYTQLALPGSDVQVKYYERVVYPFDALFRNYFNDDKNIQLVTHATVTDIILHGTNSVAHLNAATPDGKSLQVNAKLFVLACGGIGNVKVLLNANGVEKNGLGNAHDLVGRHFMDHPHFQFFGPPALLWLADGKADWLHHDERYKPTLGFSDERLRAEKLLNFSAQPSNSFESGYKGSGANLYRPNFAPLVSGRTTGAFHALAFRCEQSPNPASRVTLAEARDAFGLRRVHLDWQLADADRESLFRSIRLLAEELGKTSRGRVRLLLDEAAPWKTMVGGGHLMGTTRMGTAPENSVVDRDGKIHDKDNLYLAGSSVFASSGVANPTLTIMALARRLASHLQDKLRGA